MSEKNQGWKTTKAEKQPRLKNNQGWKTTKAETEKIKDLLTKIPTNNISELDDLIYAGVKLICGKIGVPLKNTKKESKRGWEIRLETQVRKLRQQAKMLKKLKNMRL